MSEILAAPDRDAILGGVVGRVVRELAYQRPAQWFRFLDDRVNLGCPDEPQRRVPLPAEGGPRCTGDTTGDWSVPTTWRRAVPSARFTVGETIEIDEPYLPGGLASMLRDVVEAMAAAAIRRSSGPSAP